MTHPLRFIKISLVKVEGGEKIKQLRINEAIHSPQVKLINTKGKFLGIFDLETALAIAEKHNLDLVEVSDKSSPPVCKLMDYGKYRYQQLKKQRQQKKQQKKRELKNIRLSARIEEHDLEVKLRQAKKFLTKGHKVKVFLILRGREISHSDKALSIINRFVKNLEEFYKNKEGPKREKNIIEVIISP